MDEVDSAKLTCLAKRLQRRELYDLHELLESGRVYALEAWELYLRKAPNHEGDHRENSAWAVVYRGFGGEFWGNNSVGPQNGST